MKSLPRVPTTRISLTFLALLGAASIGVEPAAAAAALLEAPVRTAAGLISGVPSRVKGVTAFKGIPFAAPPVGALRWKPAEPAAAWSGLRAADRFGPVCIQPHQPQRVPNNRAVDLPDSPPMSEDCLYLNVWTPARTARAKLPVMVWIFGGAYTEGSGSSPHDAGGPLAAKGVVVVTFNYRLGALGFLAHRELTAESPHHASGNYALTDALAALQWVQHNIAAFGGDPANVTIFGESAGAAISAALVGSPLAAGLFRRAISESGTWMGLNLAPMRTLESAEQQTLEAAAALGASDLAALRALPAQEAATRLPKQGMIIDGWVIPEDLTRTFAERRENAVDVLVGSNRDEGSFARGLGPPMTVRRWHDTAVQRWGELAPLALAAYPAASDAEAAADSIGAFADNMTWIMRLFAAQQRAIGKRAYVYQFVHAPPYAPGARNLAVCHTCEMVYVFDNLGALRQYPDSSSPQLALRSPIDRKVAAITSSYWVNFARTGDPNGPGLPKWPVFKDATHGPVLEIAASPVVGDSLGPKKAKLYQALYDRLLHGLASSVPAAGAAGAEDAPPWQPGSDWESYNKSLDGQRYSPLSEITPANAASLVEVCRARVAARGSLQAGLVVVGDSLFVTTATDTLAIDPVTCRMRWRHTYHRSQQPGLEVNRGVAYLDGRVFRGTDDARLVALDAATGAELWSDVVGDASLGEYIASAPLAWNGLVIVGISGGEFGVRGRILAYEALTGREVWRFDTIPVGREAGANTWGDRKWALHGGGATWSTFTLDPVTEELFAPIGNPVPDFAASDRRGANLFTDSALVLDARTGALRWWYQLEANDDHDHDLAAAPLLYRDSRHEDMMAAAGKDGLLHIVDRASHAVRFRVPVTTVDPVRKVVTRAGVRVCPGPAGGVLWNGPAFDPRRMTLFVGADDLCMLLKSAPGSAYVPRGLNFGGSAAPSGDIPTGWLSAVNADTGAVRWRYHDDAPVLAGTTPTAGGIVMTGDNGGNFLVFASDSGALLLKHPTGGALAGGVVTYARGGKQYVAFTSGNVSPASFGAAVGRPSVVVMALPAVAAPATAPAAADPARGREVYAQACAACHGLNGDKVAGQDLKSAKSRMSAAQIAAFILNPAPPMPRIFPEPRTAEDERDARDVAAFVDLWPAVGTPGTEKR
jgi:para-nitrobenzyl esterase